MKYSILNIFLLSAFFFGCKDNLTVPENIGNLSQERYSRYIKNLENSRKNNNKYKESIALANLNFNSVKVYELLNESIEEDTTVCYELLDYNKLFVEDGFRINLIKVDEIAWKLICEKCRKIIPEEIFRKKQLEKLKKYKEKVSKINIDSSKLNSKLITVLDEVYFNDQNLRKKMNKMNRKELWKEQHVLDSLNLIIIDGILNDYGFPDKNLVGLDHMQTVWLVLHHQPNLNVRKKYQAYLEEAVENNLLNKNLLDNYNERTRDIAN